MLPKNQNVMAVSKIQEYNHHFFPYKFLFIHLHHFGHQWYMDNHLGIQSSLIQVEYLQYMEVLMIKLLCLYYFNINFLKSIRQFHYLHHHTQIISNYTKISCNPKVTILVYHKRPARTHENLALNIIYYQSVNK